MLFSGYICATSDLKFAGVVKHLSDKEATNQSLNQKSRCFYIGAFFFMKRPQPFRALSAQTLCLTTTTALADAADKYFYLLDRISTGKFYRRNDHLFQARRVAALVTNKMNMIIPVMTLGALILTQRITYRIIRRRYAVYQSFFKECLQSAVNRHAIEFLPCILFDIAV
jgi:hypothetical protein